MSQSNNIELFTIRHTYNPNSNSLNRKTEPKVKDKHIDGFNVICLFHQFVGLPYYGMRPSFNKFRSFIGIAYSLAFIAIFIVSLVPCILICDKGNAIRYKSARLNRSKSACIIEIILIGVEAYHTIDNDLGLLYARHEFQHFYKLLKNIVSKYSLVLTVKLKRRLLFTAWTLIILNIFHAVLEIIFLYPIIFEEIAEQSDYEKAYIELPKEFSLYFTLLIRAMGSIHSKALDTLIVYFSLLLTYYVRVFGHKVKELCDSVESSDSNSKIKFNKTICTFDDLRQAYVSIEDLVIKANNCLSPCILLTIACNVIAIMGGIFIGIDIFGQGAKMEEEEAFDLFNAFICITALFVCTIFGDNIIKETQIALRQLERIRFNKIDDKDYRSVKTLIDSIEESKIQALNGTGFFILNKKLLYQIWALIIPLTILLSQKY